MVVSQRRRGILEPSQRILSFLWVLWLSRNIFIHNHRNHDTSVYSSFHIVAGVDAFSNSPQKRKHEFSPPRFFDSCGRWSPKPRRFSLASHAVPKFTIDDKDAGTGWGNNEVSQSTSKLQASVDQKVSPSSPSPPTVVTPAQLGHLIDHDQDFDQAEALVKSTRTPSLYAFAMVAFGQRGQHQRVWDLFQFMKQNSILDLSTATTNVMSESLTAGLQAIAFLVSTPAIIAESSSSSWEVATADAWQQVVTLRTDYPHIIWTASMYEAAAAVAILACRDPPNSHFVVDEPLISSTGLQSKDLHAFGGRNGASLKGRFSVSSFSMSPTLREAAWARVAELRRWKSADQERQSSNIAFPVTWSLPRLYSKLVQAARTPEEAVELLEEFVNDDHSHSTKTKQLGSMRKHNQHQTAVGATTLRIQSWRFCNTVLQICAAAGDYHQTEHVLDTMVNKLKCAPNVKQATWHLNALAKAEKDHDAVVFLESMTTPSRGSKMHENSNYSPRGKLVKVVQPTLPGPDAVAVRTALLACVATRNYALARDVLEKTKQGKYNTDGIRIRVDQSMYHLVLATCRDPLEAKAVIREMRLTRRHRTGVVPPTRQSYTRAIVVCRQAGDLNAALNFLDAAKNDGIKPDTHLYSSVLWTAAQVVSNPDENAYDHALAIWNEMKTSKCKPSVVSYNGMLAVLAGDSGKQRGDGRRYINLLKELHQEDGLEGNWRTYYQVARGLRTIEPSQRIDFLEQVFGLMTEGEHICAVCGPVAEALILNYCRMGDFSSARNLFDALQSNGPVDAPCLRAILYACANTSPPTWQQAISLLHSCDVVDGTYAPAYVDGIAVAHVVTACAKANEWEEAWGILELYGPQILSITDKAGEKSGMRRKMNKIKLGAWNALIAACGRSGRPDRAIEALNVMEDYGARPDGRSYRNAIIACNQAQHARRRKKQQAKEQQSNTEGKKRRRISPAAEVGPNEIEEDDDVSPPPIVLEWWECGLSLLRRMHEGGLVPDVQTYSSVISACEAAGTWQRALGVLEQMGSDSWNSYCFNAAISACEKGGAWVEALELYETMKSRNDDDQEKETQIPSSLKPNAVTLGSLILALDKAAQKELAQSVYEEGLRSGILMSPWRSTLDANGSSIRAMDLHHHSAALARTAIRYHLEGLIERGNPDVLTEAWIVIVGKGLRSEEEPILYSAVKTLLKREFGIVANVTVENQGRLVIEADVLRNLVAQKSWR